MRKCSMLILGLMLIFVGLLTPASMAQEVPLAQGTANITVDYNNSNSASLQQLASTAIGIDESGYYTPDVLVNDWLQQKRLATLGVKYMRMNLSYSTPGNPSSTIICGGLGCDQRWTGDQWVQAIEQIGATPVIEVPSLVADAANLVRHFNLATAHPMRYWIVGNEPDLHGVSADEYSATFNQVYDAMKAVDPSISIGGGTTAWYDRPFLQTFLRLSGSRVDFVDFHGYAQQGNVPGDPAALLQHTEQYGADLQDLRSLIQSIVPQRSAQIGMEVGEWEMDWGGSAQDDTPMHTVWVASVLGSILRAGGWSLLYADKGNALYGSDQTITDASGHTINVARDDPTPVYHGIGMFTGEGLFQGFGRTMVAASTTLPQVDVFASDDPRNIVVVNKDLTQTRTAVVALPGVSWGKITVWRKDPSIPLSAPPVRMGTIQVHDGFFTYPLSPCSVITFVLEAGLK